MKRNYVPGTYETLNQSPAGTITAGQNLYFVIDGYYKFLLSDIILFYGVSKSPVNVSQYQLVTDEKYTAIEADFSAKTMICQVKFLDSGLNGQPFFVSGRNYGTFTDNEATVAMLDTEVPVKIDQWWAVEGPSKSDLGHIHDDRYYTETEINAKLGDVPNDGIARWDGSKFTDSGVKYTAGVGGGYWGQGGSDATIQWTHPYLKISKPFAQALDGTNSDHTVRKSQMDAAIDGVKSKGAENAIQGAGATAGTFKDSGFTTPASGILQRSDSQAFLRLEETKVGIGFDNGDDRIYANTVESKLVAPDLVNEFRVSNTLAESTVPIEHPPATALNQSVVLSQIENVEAYGVHAAIKPVGSPFTKNTRTFTIPAGWIFHTAFEEYTAPQLSVVVPAVAGDYIIFLNVATKQLNASITFPLWGVGIPVARLAYSQVANDEITMGWENHGVRTEYDSMITEAHHKCVGMLAELSATPQIIEGGQGTAVIGITGGGLWDEDKYSVVGSKPADGTAVWAKFYYYGLASTNVDKLERFPLDFTTATTTQLRKIFATDTDLGVGSTGRACFNNYPGGSFVPQPIGANSVMLMHVFANDGILDTSALVMGQKEYAGANLNQSIQLARTGASSEIRNIRMSEGSARDALYVGSVIINASGQKQWVDDAQTTTVIQPSASGTSSGGSTPTTLQGAYNASTPSRTTTDAVRGAVRIRRGSGADTDNVQEYENGAGSVVAGVRGNGTIFGSNALAATDFVNRQTGDARYASLNGATFTGAVSFTNDLYFADTPTGGIQFGNGRTGGLSRGWLQQGDTSGNLTYWYFNGSSWGNNTSILINGTLVSQATPAQIEAVAGSKGLTTVESVKALIGRQFTQTYVFNRIVFQMSGGNVDIPKAHVREGDTTQTYALRSGAKAPVPCKITGFNCTFLTQAGDANVFYKINEGAWVLIGTVTSATGQLTVLYGTPIQIASNDYVRISFTGPNGEYTGISVDAFVREATL